MHDDMLVERDIMVPMRDGIRLACDVYRPTTAGQTATGAFPVILERTPYGKGQTSRSEISRHHPERPRSRQEVAAFFVQHGYVVVYQDCRGRYGSEGVFEKYLAEAADGYDTCAWLVQQSWCNGRIGTMGLSYAAHTQVALASLNPPGLAAMFVDSGGFSAVEVTGPIVVHLWMSSDCPDTDCTARLIDVYPPNADYPDGYAMNLTGGILRLRYRDAWGSSTLMQPGQVYAIRIDLFPCSNWFAPGHRLRLDIASSNFPHFDLNFNTGEAEGLSTHARVATNTVYVDQARPSHVLLPLIPIANRR